MSPSSRQTGEAVRVATLFRAFSDRTRLRLLHLLRAHAEVCVGDLVAVLGAPQATVSRHLAYLRRVGLVRVRKDGPWKHYSLTPAGTPLHRCLLASLDACAGEIRELAADHKRQQRLKSCCAHGLLTADLAGLEVEGGRRDRARQGRGRAGGARSAEMFDLV